MSGHIQGRLAHLILDKDQPLLLHLFESLADLFHGLIGPAGNHPCLLGDEAQVHSELGLLRGKESAENAQLHATVGLGTCIWPNLAAYQPRSAALG